MKNYVFKTFLFLFFLSVLTGCDILRSIQDAKLIRIEEDGERKMLEYIQPPTSFPITEFSFVSKAELDCNHEKFIDRFRVKYLEGYTMLRYDNPEYVSVGRLMDKIENLSCGTDQQIFIAVHFGLKDELYLTYAYQIFCSSKDEGDSFAVRSSSELYNGGDFENEISGGLEAWYSEGNPGYNYIENILIGQNKKGLYKRMYYTHEWERDVRFVVHPWNDRVEQLVEQNTLKRSDLIAPISMGELASIPSSMEESIKDYHHHTLCFVAYKASLDGTEYAPQIDNELYLGRSFQMKGSDLGTPCPANCDYTEIRTSGNPEFTCE